MMSPARPGILGMIVGKVAPQRGVPKIIAADANISGPTVANLTV
jgi:hypothetical protein